MKKTLFLSAILLCVSFIAQSQNKTLNITQGGLEAALNGDYAFTTLTVSGAMDVRDFACLNENAMNITSIDLSGCNIVAYDSRDEQYLGYRTHFEANTIPPSAFLGFKELKTVTLPASVVAIGDGAFAGCENLTTIVGGEAIEMIGDYAFSGCDMLRDITLSTSLYRIGDYAFDKCASLVEVNLSACQNLAYVGKRAFAQNALLATVKMPQEVGAIGDAAFAGCGNLTLVEMPQNINNIATGVFAACTSLQKIDLSQSNISVLPAWIFSGCCSLTDVALPNALSNIGEGAFYYCTSLSMIQLPIGIESIDDFSFAGCSGLNEVTFLPDGMETIGRYSFYQNTAVDSVILPASVAYIGDHAFDGCINANSFDTPREIPAELGEMVFANMEVEQKTLTVPSEGVIIYQSTAQWQDFGKISASTGLEDVIIRNDLKAVFHQYNLVVSSQQEMTDVRLYDTAGMLLAHSTTRTQEVTIDTRAFAGNIYLLQVTTADGNTVVTKVARVIR